MDIDKKFPTISFNAGKKERCEAVLNVDQARGAVWLGDVICQGLKTYASTQFGEGHNES